MLRRVGHHFLRPLGVIAELLDQQDQAHRPRHQKHNADQQPRAEIIVVIPAAVLSTGIRPLLRPEVVVILKCHCAFSPLCCNFRLFPFSSTIQVCSR